MPRHHERDHRAGRPGQGHGRAHGDAQKRANGQGLRRGLAAGITFVVVSAVLSILGMGWAAPAGADTTITVRGAADDRYVPGQPLPVIVTVKADRLIQGVVRVTPNFGNGPRVDGNGSSGVDIPIEVAGGTTKTAVATVATSSSTTSGDRSDFSVSIELLQGDTSLASTTLNVSAKDWEETVGILPGLAAAGQVPDTAPMRFASGIAHLVVIDPLILEAGGAGFGPFHTVVAGAADLDAMAPAARAGLLEWVAGGGHLLVDAASAPVAGLPAEWQPTNGWALAGGGDIRLIKGEAAAGHWTDILDPTDGGSIALSAAARGQGASDLANGRNNMDDFSTVEGSLGHDAGFRLPQMGQLVGLLVVYVVVVGPITFIVLARMKRRMVAWVAVPALAALFTVMFAVAGSGLRNSTDASHGTVIDITPTGTRATTSMLVGSIGGGTVDVQMPGGWRHQAAIPDTTALGWRGMGGDSSQSPTRAPALTTSATGVTAEMALSPGEFAMVQTTGPVSGYDGAFSIDARTDGATVTGTVKNNLDVALTEVAVLVNESAVEVGTIAPHGEAAYRVATPLAGGSGLPELAGWPINPQDTSSSSFGGGGAVQIAPAIGVACSGGPCPETTVPARRATDANTVVNTPLWRAYAATHQATLRSLGTVSAVGWTDALPAPVRVDERPIDRGRTAIVSHATIAVDALDTVGVRIDEARDADLRKFDRPGNGEPDPSMIVNGTLYRIVLPPSVDGRPLDPSKVTIKPPPGLHAIAIPGSDGWTILPEQSAPIEYHVKPTDVVNGVVYVRTRLADHLNGGAGAETGWQVKIGEGTGTGIVLDDPTSASSSSVDGGVKGVAPTTVVVTPPTTSFGPPPTPSVPEPAVVTTTTQAPVTGPAAPGSKLQGER